MTLTQAGKKMMTYATMFSLASLWQQEWLNCPAPELTERSQLFDQPNSPDENRQQIRLKELSLIRLGFDPTPITDIRGRVSSNIGLGSSTPLST
jgi:hypothetical protein